MVDWSKVGLGVLRQPPFILPEFAHVLSAQSGGASERGAVGCIVRPGRLALALLAVSAGLLVLLPDSRWIASRRREALPNAPRRP